MSFVDSEAVAKEEDLKPLVCLVCRRASNTGHHYGVTACLGCKTFFRRVVIQGRTPRCKQDGKCALQKGDGSKGIKRICRSCRYQRCKEIGMKEEALHPCRDLIGNKGRNCTQFIGKRKESLSLSDSGDDSQQPVSSTAIELTSQEEASLELIRTIKDADINMRASRISSAILESTEKFTININLPTTLKTSISSLRQWVQRVPGYSQLTQSTKRFLLHRFCLAFMIVESSLLTSRTAITSNRWYLPDGTFLTRVLESIKVQSDLTKEHKLLLPVSCFVLDEVVEPFRKLKPTDEEAAVLKTTALEPTILRDESSELSTEEDRKLLKTFRDTVLQGLHVYLTHLQPEEHPERRLADLLMPIGSIEICSSQMLEYLHMMRFFNLGQLDLDTEKVIFGIS